MKTLKFRTKLLKQTSSSRSRAIRRSVRKAQSLYGEDCAHMATAIPDKDLAIEISNLEENFPYHGELPDDETLQRLINRTAYEVMNSDSEKM